MTQGHLGYGCVNGSNLVALRKAWPRQDVLQGGFADNHFAAQLDKVVRDPEHYPVYGDADAFFAQTFPRSGLKTLLAKTFGRVSGAKGIAGETACCARQPRSGR